MIFLNHATFGRPCMCSNNVAPYFLAGLEYSLIECLEDLLCWNWLTDGTSKTCIACSVAVACTWTAAVCRTCDVQLYEGGKPTPVKPHTSTTGAACVCAIFQQSFRVLTSSYAMHITLVFKQWINLTVQMRLLFPHSLTWTSRTWYQASPPAGASTFPVLPTSWGWYERMYGNGRGVVVIASWRRWRSHSTRRRSSSGTCTYVGIDTEHSVYSVIWSSRILSLAPRQTMWIRNWRGCRHCITSWGLHPRVLIVDGCTRFHIP